MSCFSNILSASSEFKTILSNIRSTRLPMGVLGLSHIHKAHLILSLSEVLRRKSVVLTPDEAQAARLT